MDKIKIGLGGHPFTGDDMEWLQTAIAAAINGAVGGEDFVVLHGVALTIGGGNITWTDGWIYIDDELCQVDAGSLPYPANNTFVIQETNNLSGTVTYEDLNLENTWVFRKATILGNAGGAYLVDNIKYRKLSAIEPWKSITALTVINWSPGGGGVVNGYRRTQTHDVAFNGSLVIGSYDSLTDEVMFQMEAGYLPAREVNVIAPAIKNGNDVFIRLKILANGEVRPQGLVNTDAVEIFLDSVRYPLDWSGLI